MQQKIAEHVQKTFKLAIANKAPSLGAQAFLQAANANNQGHLHIIDES